MPEKCNIQSITGEDAPPSSHLGHIETILSVFASNFPLQRACTWVFGTSTEQISFCLYQNSSSLITQSCLLSSAKSKNTCNLHKPLLLTSVHSFTDSPNLTVTLPFIGSQSSVVPPIWVFMYHAAFLISCLSPYPLLLEVMVHLWVETSCS